MEWTGRIAVCIVLAAVLSAPAQTIPLPMTRGRLDRVNRTLHGRLVDHTNSHGAQRRIWSEALCQRRDMYVYLPPGFNPCCTYPLIIWLHRYHLGEHDFFNGWVQRFDEAIASGCLPPVIIAAPDGSLAGRTTYSRGRGGSFYVNSDAGRFEDFIMGDVWSFLHAHYPIRPEREAHFLAGMSMGGFGAFNLGIKYRDRIGAVVGILPPLNLRWLDCHGRYRGNFDPNCWGWREDVRGYEVLGRFFLGSLTIRARHMIRPLYGMGPESVARFAQENPIELLDLYHVQPGELDMYVGYVGRDEFNIDAQVESFLYRARQLGLDVGVEYNPRGHHFLQAAHRLLPGAIRWLAPRLRALDATCPPISPAITANESLP